MAYQAGAPETSGATTKLDTKQPVGPAAPSPKSVGTFGKSDKIDRADAGFDTNYSRNNYAGPSSVTNVAKSADLADFSVQIDDPVLKRLAATPRKTALEDDSGEVGNPTADLERKISTEGYPPAHGMKNPNASPIKISGDLDKTEGEPVRKP